MIAPAFTAIIHGDGRYDLELRGLQDGRVAIALGTADVVVSLDHLAAAVGALLAIREDLP